MAFTAADVKKLREMTDCGMMECKKALTDADGDMDKAVEILREKGLATAAKKAGRVAAEGVCAAYVAPDGACAGLVEVNIETDFAANNADFRAFAADLAKLVAEKDPADMDAFMAMELVPGKSVEDVRKEKVATIRENMQVRRFARYAGGKIGVLLNMDVSADIAGKAEVEELGKDLAMQVAAMNPLFLDKSDVDEATLAKEKEILLIQAKQDEKNKGKPDNIIEKMVMGRIGKYFSENCLMQQEFVKSLGDKVTCEKHVAEVAKALGGTIAIKGFKRFLTGEGIEKKADDFAAEVASMVK